MKICKKITKGTRIALIACLVSVVSGCAVNPYTGERQVSDTAIGGVAGAGGGALIGGLIGGQTGALIGAGAGGLTGGLIGHHFDNVNAELHQRLVRTGIQVRKVGNSIQLIMASDITFQFNQSKIKPNFYGPLDSISLVLKKYKNNLVNITGYTDNVGNPAYNQVLSERRAEAVQDYLISQGISSRRIFTKGFGERNPIASNASAAGRQANRRVVITLTPIS